MRQGYLCQVTWYHLCYGWDVEINEFLPVDI